MDIRIAKNEQDARAASRIITLSWQAGYRGVFSDAVLEGLPLDFWVDTLKAHHETGRFQTAILRAEGEDVGIGCFGLSRDYESPALGEVISFYFLPRAWGKGYAGALMDGLVDALRGMGCETVYVWTLSDNVRAQRFYERYGFQRTGRENPVAFQGEGKINVEYVMDLRG